MDAVKVGEITLELIKVLNRVDPSIDIMTKAAACQSAANLLQAVAAAEGMQIALMNALKPPQK